MTSLDKSYQRYFTGGSSTCKVSISDVSQANQLLDHVLQSFRMRPSWDGQDVMDLGCGLGCVAEAFQTRGALVLALDNSPQAVDHVARTYPEVDAECAAFGPDYRTDRRFDLIWIRDFSLCNTLDWAQFESTVLQPSLKLLKPGGTLLMGLRSSFTGAMDSGNWANWRYGFVRRLVRGHGAEGPRVVQFRSRLVGWAVLTAARLLRRKIPFYVRITAPSDKDASQ